MKNEHIIIAIIVIVILFLIWNDNKEHLTGNEAVLNISKVYSDSLGTASFNKINVTSDLSSNKINTNSLNVTTDLSSNTINTNNFIINTKKFRMFWVKIGGYDGYILVKEPQGNTYNAKDWVLFSGGPQHVTFVHYALLINKTDNLWYIDKQGQQNMWIYTSILCIPVEMFDNNFTYPMKADNISDTTSSRDGTTSVSW